MPKNQKKQVIYCLQHDFALTPIKSQLYFKQPVTLSFCKGKLQTKCRGCQQKKRPVQQNCACFPIYNKDKNYATSSFILPDQQQNFIENSQKLKLEHQQRVWQYNEQKSKLFIPKPKTRYSYCNSCRENYQDYLEHIKLESHKNGIKKSKISQYIKEIQKKYTNLNKQSQQKNKKNIIKNSDNCGASTTNYFSQTDIAGEIQELGRPQKKVKLSNNNYKEIQNNFPYSNYANFNQNNLQGFQSTNPNNMSVCYPNGPNSSMCGAYRPAQLYPMNYSYNYNYHNGNLNQYGYPPFHMNMFCPPYMCWGPYNNIYNVGLNMNLQMIHHNNNFSNGLDGSMPICRPANKPIIIDLQDKQN